MKFQNTRVYGMGPAIDGMRNAKESWEDGDSYYEQPGIESSFRFGDKDMALARRLIKAGPDERKFMRQIHVSVKVIAPEYWWKEFDTYKVGVVRNSTSTMHKLATTPITKDCFEMGDYESAYSLPNNGDEFLIKGLEYLRTRHLEALQNSKRSDISPRERAVYQDESNYYWKELVRWLPMSWLYTATLSLSYENLLNMCRKTARRFHKLNEWSGKEHDSIPHFIGWARTLPYAQQLIFGDELED